MLDVIRTCSTEVWYVPYAVMTHSYMGKDIIKEFYAAQFSIHCTNRSEDAVSDGNPLLLVKTCSVCYINL